MCVFPDRASTLLLIRGCTWDRKRDSGKAGPDRAPVIPLPPEFGSTADFVRRGGLTSSRKRRTGQDRTDAMLRARRSPPKPAGKRPARRSPPPAALRKPPAEGNGHAGN